MTEAPAKPNSPAIIKGQNGNHSLVAPRKDEKTPELPEGYWRGCDEHGTPRDPANPWHWSIEKKDS